MHSGTVNAAIPRIFIVIIKTAIPYFLAIYLPSFKRHTSDILTQYDLMTYFETKDQLRPSLTLVIPDFRSLSRSAPSSSHTDP